MAYMTYHVYHILTLLIFIMLCPAHKSSGNPRDTAQVMEFIRKSDNAIYTNPQDALTFANNALKISEQTGFVKGLAKSYERLGNIYFHLGNKSEAEFNYMNALNILKTLPEHDIAGSINYNLGNLHYELGNYDSTLYFTDKASEHYLAANDSGGYAFCIFMDAQIYEQKGNYYLSLKHKLEALEIFRNKNMKIWETDCLMSIADIYALREENQKALSIYQQCLANYREANDKKFECVALRNIAFQHAQLRDFNKSLEYLDASIAISRASGYLPEENKSLSRKGDVLIETGRYKEAEIIFREALALSKEINDGYYVSRNLTGLAQSLLHQGDFTNAVKFLLDGLQNSKNIENKPLKRDIYQNLAMAYDSLNRLPEAFTSYKVYSSLKDSIIKEENSRQLDEVKAEYDIQKAENEISLLEQEKSASDNIRKLTLAGWLLTAFSGILIVWFFVYKSRKNRQLLEKEKEVDKLKSKFFADISHEFRTPLTLILGPLSNLKNDTKLLSYRTDLDLIQNNARRLLHLINQILDLSKLESGNYTLTFSRNIFSDFINRIFYTYQSYAEAKNIQLILEDKTNNQEADFDPVNLEIVFNNLLSNALKFEPQNGNVLVSTEVKQNMIEVIVKNSGSVIPDEHQKNIFNRYFSFVDGSQNGLTNTGTGIGLALAKEITDLHHGDIRVQSSKMDGTTFTVRLPVTQNAIIPTKPKRNISSKPFNSRLNHQAAGFDVIVNDASSGNVKNSIPGNKKDHVVLVIEDNEEVRNFIRDSLMPFYDVLTAPDGPGGVKTAIEYIPDVVVSDVMMPGKSGMEVCNELKANEITSHIPVILLTAKISQQSKIEGYKNKADAYIAKPFEPEELRVRIKSLLDNRKLVIQKYKINYQHTEHEVSEKSIDQVFLDKLHAIISENIANDSFNVEELCKSAGISRSQMHRKLIAIAGMSASEFIRNFRLEKAMELLKNNVGTASEVAYMVGFQSPIYFSKCFRDYFDITPGFVRKSKQEAKKEP